MGPVRFDQNVPLTRDSGELRQIRLQIRNLRKKLGHIELVRVGPGFIDRITVRFGISDRAGPVRARSGGPEFRTGPLTRPRKTRTDPDQPYMTQLFA